MAALTNQVSANSKEFFFLLANISSLKVKSLEASNVTVFNTLTASQSLLSSIQANSISTSYIQSDMISSFYIDTQVISTFDIESDFGNISTLVSQNGNISSIVTNNITLDGNTLDTGGVGVGSVLLLNGLPIATGTSSLSSIQDWSFFPALSTIQMGGFGLSNVGNMNSQNITNALNITTDTLTVNTAMTSPNATITNLRTTNLSSVNFVTSNLVVTQNAQIENLSTGNLIAGNGNFSSIFIQNATISSISGGGSASNWYLFPAQSTVSFAQLIPGTDTPIYSLVGACNITCANLTAQLSGVPPSYGGVITGGLVQGLTGSFNTISGQNATLSNNAETADMSIYGVNLVAGDNALYVEGGTTLDGGQTVHGITMGTNTYGVSLNRIDILPIGTQSHITWGAQAMIAGLGMTLDAGLGINIAAGLVVDVLASDIQLRANDDIIMDATDTIDMTANTININTNTLSQTANNFTFNDSNFIVNSSNENVFNASRLSQGTPLPPSTIGFYSTIQQNSEIENSPSGTRMTAQSVFGLFQNISTVGFVVTSNISTIYTPSSTGIVSTFTSSFTSSLVRQYSTLSFTQLFPTGEVVISPSSLLLQHADKIELDTKPFPVFTNLTLGQSTIVSSLYTYEAITDGNKYSEVGQIIQAITPVVETLSTFFLSTGVSSGTVVSTLTSSFFSTLTSQTSFTSTIYNMMNFNSNCFSTPALCVSSINDFLSFPSDTVKIEGNFAQLVLSNDGSGGQRGTLTFNMTENNAEIKCLDSNNDPLTIYFTADNFGFNVPTITGGIEMDISGNTQIQGDLIVTDLSVSTIITPTSIEVVNINNLSNINGKDIYTFGEFLTLSTITVSASNTPTVIPFDNSPVGNRIVLNTGAIEVQQLGLYKFNVSIQLDKSGGGVSLCDFWLRVNTIDVANSASRTTVQGNNGEVLAACSYFLTLNANDLVELVFASDDDTMAATTFAAQASPWTRPEIPAVIANMVLLR